MQVSVEKLEGLQRRMTVQVPAQEIDREIQSRLLSLSRRVKLDGFRPGKAPLKIVKRFYGTQVRQEVLGEVLQSSLRDALTRENLKPVGGPKIEAKNLGDESGDMEYSATFEVLPEFELVGIDGIQVERPTAQVTEADIDAMIESLRKQRVIWNVVERPSQQGDRVTLSLEASYDGEDLPERRREDAVLVLGEGSMIKEFEDKLVGFGAGDETEFEVFFPEDYLAKDFAGKPIRFKVKFKAVAEASLPEIDDQFAASMDVKENGVEGLRKALRENMERELRNAIKAVVKGQVMQHLLQANAITLPQTMVNQEIDNLAKQLHFPKDTEDEEKLAGLKTELLEPEARRRVALGLILSNLVTTQQIKLDENRVLDHVQSIASTYNEVDEVRQWYLRNPQALGGIRALTLEDQVIDWLLERAVVTEQPSTFSEIMRPRKAMDSSQE